MVDGWRLSKRWFWPERHNEILHRLLARARRGTRVVYLPGNHEEALRKLIGRTLCGVRFRHDAVHRTADGRRLLVTHGDAFDGVCTDMKWLARLGSVAYGAALALNSAVNHVRCRLGLRYWPISAFLRRRSTPRSTSSSATSTRSPPRGAAARSQAWSAATPTSRRCG